MMKTEFSNSLVKNVVVIGIAFIEHQNNPYSLSVHRLCPEALTRDLNPLGCLHENCLEEHF